MAAGGKMTFTRFGRSFHLRIDSADDLRHAAELDEALWVATNAPIGQIHCDPTLLNMLDTDGKGRITARELKSVIRWLLDTLSDHNGIDEGSTVLRFAAINESTEDGSRIAAAAAKMLRRLDAGDSKQITLQQVREIRKEVEATPVSEAGLVPPEAGEDEIVRTFIKDMIETIGGTKHLSGSMAVGASQLEKFLADARAYLDWHNRGVLADDAIGIDVMPLGAATKEAYAVLAGVRGKIDEYFAQCQALVTDERFVQPMGWAERELVHMDFDDPAAVEAVLSRAPLARANTARELIFNDPINPHYAARIEEFRHRVLGPVLGDDAGDRLTSDGWRKIKDAFATHQLWVLAKPDVTVAKLGAETLGMYLDEKFAAELTALIERSKAAAVELADIRLTEKLILAQGHMLELANNFVSFPRLYDADRRAMFEMGTLVADGRRFCFALHVIDRKKHAKIATASNMFVMYVNVTPRDRRADYEVAIPVTSGGRGNLAAGKRGVFYEIDGAECDAQIVQIIENPISLREAFFSPFKRLGRLLTGKIESLTTEAEKKLDKAAAEVATSPKPAPRAKSGGLSGGGAMIGAGLAIAALGSAMAYITKSLSQVHWWQVLVGVACAIIAVMLPTSIVAFMKLRKRDLSAILEGAGWAINARMRLTRKLGVFFTNRPKYPAHARGLKRFRRR